MTKPMNFPGRKQERRLRALSRMESQTTPSKMTRVTRRNALNALTIKCGEHVDDYAVRSKKNRAGFARFARA